MVVKQNCHGTVRCRPIREHENDIIVDIVTAQGGGVIVIAVNADVGGLINSISLEA